MTKKQSAEARQKKERLFALPPDTRAVFSDDYKGYLNLQLLIDKFIPYELVENKWEITIRLKEKKQGQLTDRVAHGGEAKGLWVREDPKKEQDSRGELRFQQLDPPLRLSKHFDSELIKNSVSRWLAMTSSCTAKMFSSTVDYRLVVGFGAEHVLETSLYLHRIHGFPIIPGSAVKGVTRARAFWDIAERLELRIVPVEEAQRREQLKQRTPLQKMDELLHVRAEKEIEKLLRALKDLEGKPDPFCSDKVRALDVNGWLAITDDFYQTFGTTEHQGKVTFFDAYPTSTPTLEPDILNPHYGKYYGDKTNTEPPADYLSPVPTFFLTVAKGSQFQFAISGKAENLVDKAESWLRRALQDLGIGGKTAAGYGFLRTDGI